MLDDDLLAEAQRLTGIERESARRLARLGGTEPALTAIPRVQQLHRRGSVEPRRHRRAAE